MNYTGTVLHLHQKIAVRQVHFLRLSTVCVHAHVCVESQVSALTLSGDITVRQYRGDKVRDVTLERQRHSEIIQAPRKSQLPLCVYMSYIPR